MFQIVLPTQVEIQVQFKHYQEKYHNVYITPSIEDYEIAGGLCGYITRNGQRVEARLRNGVIESNLARFAEDW